MIPEAQAPKPFTVRIRELEERLHVTGGVS